MRGTSCMISVAVLFSCLANGQDTDSKLAFEVASVKPSPPLDATVSRAVSAAIADPGRFERHNARLTELIMFAYGLKAYQVLGPPLLTSERYEISAKLPDGATKSQVPAMLLSLLADRFHLQAHRDTREMPVYALVVLNGDPKFKEAMPEAERQSAAAPAAGPPKRKTDADGFPILSRNEGTAMGLSATRRRLLALHEDLTVEALIAILSTQLDRPISDRTDLKGKYDIALHWAADATDSNDSGSVTASTPLPDLFVAIQAQLGLKLEPKKAAVEVMVVDRVEKVPTGN
jgi:uncharacterized protein (TIGR03435 family)